MAYGRKSKSPKAYKSMKKRARSGKPKPRRRPDGTRGRL